MKCPVYHGFMLESSYKIENKCVVRKTTPALINLNLDDVSDTVWLPITGVVNKIVKKTIQ